MSYVIPDNKWVETELRIIDGMGRSWYLRNPPKIWKIEKKESDLILESLKKKLKQNGFKFKVNESFAHRFLRDLVSEELKIVIHHRDPEVSEAKLMKVLGYKFFKFNKKNWKGEIETLIGELKNESESMAR